MTVLPLVTLGGRSRRRSSVSDFRAQIDRTISSFANGIRALRSSGLAEVHDHLLPENPMGFEYENKRTILLPGAQTLSFADFVHIGLRQCCIHPLWRRSSLLYGDAARNCRGTNCTKCVTVQLPHAACRARRNQSHSCNLFAA